MKKVRSNQAPIPINSCTELSETQFFPVITGGAGGLLCPFSEIAKKCPNFGGKCPDCGHLWVKFLI